jgi:hypothetical protein
MVVQPSLSGSPPFYSEFSRPPNALAHVRAIRTKGCRLRLEESNNQNQPSKVLFGKGEVEGEEASIDQAVRPIRIHRPADSCD